MHLRPGCTGRIGKLVVVQRSGDGVKVAEGVHDLVVGGGSIRCLAKAPDFHQDGIQVLGGARITFRELTVSCGRRDDRLINSNLFIKQAGKSQLPPRDVVCENCSFGGWAAHTVSVQASVRSGVTGSKICVARFPQFTLDRRRRRERPARLGEPRPAVQPGQAHRRAGPRTVEFGEGLQLHGLFLGQLPGARVVAQVRAPRDAEVRARGRHAQQAQRPLPAHRAPADRRDRAAALGLDPRAGACTSTSGRAWCCDAKGAVARGRRCAPGRSYAGRFVVLQVQRHGHWVGVQQHRAAAPLARQVHARPCTTCLVRIAVAPHARLRGRRTATR